MMPANKSWLTSILGTVSRYERSQKGKRLRPGELDGLVLAYMGKHGGGGPLTASAIGKGIDRLLRCSSKLSRSSL